MDHDGIGLILHLGEIDIQFVVHLAVTGIVHIGNLPGTMDVHLGRLETAETRRLRLQAEGSEKEGKG
jgi:hypothetical protein